MASRKDANPATEGLPFGAMERTERASGALAEDGSVRVRLPARRPLILELQNEEGTPIVTMGEEHQLGPGEVISIGVRRESFNGVCGGCHGSITGSELDVISSSTLVWRPTRLHSAWCSGPKPGWVRGSNAGLRIACLRTLPSSSSHAAGGVTSCSG